jgi:hypothetical protein
LLLLIGSSAAVSRVLRAALGLVILRKARNDGLLQLPELLKQVDWVKCPGNLEQFLLLLGGQDV